VSINNTRPKYAVKNLEIGKNHSVDREYENNTYQVVQENTGLSPKFVKVRISTLYRSLSIIYDLALGRLFLLFLYIHLIVTE
jgi:hypothetical protein